MNNRIKQQVTGMETQSRDWDKSLLLQVFQTSLKRKKSFSSSLEPEMKKPLGRKDWNGHSTLQLKFKTSSIEWIRRMYSRQPSCLLIDRHEPIDGHCIQMDWLISPSAFDTNGLLLYISFNVSCLCFTPNNCLILSPFCFRKKFLLRHTKCLRILLKSVQNHTNRSSSFDIIVIYIFQNQEGHHHH